MSKALDVLNGTTGAVRKDYDDVCIDLQGLGSTGNGPQGGNLNNPDQHPERRRAALNTALDESTGLPGLHTFERPDSALMGLKDEQPWHRMAAFMILAKRTNSEIAMAAGVKPHMISTLRGQRWFQILLGTLANEEGQDLHSAIATHAHDAINRIAEIATGDIKELGVRNVLAANQLILEHAKGKPLQSVISAVSHTTHVSPSEEMADIQQQLAALRSSATKETAAMPALPYPET